MRFRVYLDRGGIADFIDIHPDLAEVAIGVRGKDRAGFVRAGAVGAHNVNGFLRDLQATARVPGIRLLDPACGALPAVRRGPLHRRRTLHKLQAVVARLAGNVG